jgi:dolichol kinase
VAQAQCGIRKKQRINELLKELVQKATHLCAAFTPTLFRVAFVPTFILLSLVLAAYCVSETLRRKGVTVSVISAFTAACSRKRDENQFVFGPVTLACGVLLAALLFQPLSARVGIYALAFGDGLASLAGKCFGTIRIPFVPQKTVAGSAACFAAIFISVFAATGVSLTALIVAAAGTVLELIPLKDFDNILLPVAVAALHQFLL